MAFIEVRRKVGCGTDPDELEPFVVNAEQIERVEARTSGSLRAATIHMVGDKGVLYEVEEAYEGVKRLLGAVRP